MEPWEKLRNIRDFLNAVEAERDPEQVMVNYMRGGQVAEIPARTLFTHIRACAARLTALGLTEGRIGIFGPNSYEWLVTFSAVLYLGAVAVLLPAQESPEEAARDAVQTGLTAVLCAPGLEEALEQAGLTEKLPCVPFFTQEEGTEDSRPVAENASGPEDPACIFFTSGTSSRKKAVVHTNRSMLAGQCNNIVGHPFQAQLAVLPFHHLAGFCTVFNTWYLGGTVCLGEDMRYFFRYLEWMKPDYLSLVPSMLSIFVRKLRGADAHGASLGWNVRLVNCGGAAFQPETLELLLSRGITVLNSYGASEAGGIGFSCTMNLERPDTIGRPSPGLEARIQEGELLLRSASLMLGYYGDPEATAQVLREGWYHTGDLCRRDEAGYYYLTGRKNNRIILSNGENISPEELEARLNALDTVEESMVTVQNDFLAAVLVPHWGGAEDAVARAAVRARLAEEVQALNERLPSYERLEYLYLREEPFARNAMGKMIRYQVIGGEAL